MPRFSRARWIMVGACVAALSLAGAAMVTAHNGPDKVQVARAPDQRSQAQERDHVPGRRHGRLGDHRRAATTTLGAGWPPAAWTRCPFTGEQTTWSVKPGPGPHVPARLRARLGRDGHRVGDRPQDDRRAHLTGPQHRRRRPRRQHRVKTVLELAQKRGHGDRRRLDGRDHRRHAGRARLAHLPTAPARARTTRAQPASWRRKAAGGLGSIAEQEVDHQIDVILGGGKARFDQTLDAVDHDGRPHYAQAQQGLPASSTTPPTSPRVDDLDKPVLGLFSAEQHVARVERPGRPDPAGRRRLRRPGHRARPTKRPATEPRAGRHDYARPSRCSSTASAARASSCRSRARRSTSSDHAANPCQQIGETIAFDKAIGAALDFAARPPGHADPRDGRPRPHEPDRGRGLERDERPDRATRRTC